MEKKFINDLDFQVHTYLSKSIIPFLFFYLIIFFMYVSAVV